MAKSKQRKRFTPAQRRRIVAAAEKHGAPWASDKYDVSTTMIYRWRRDAEPAPEPKPAAANPRPRRPAPAAEPDRVGELERLVVELTLENRRLRAGR